MFKYNNLVLKLNACFIAIMTTSLVIADNNYMVRPGDNLNRIIAKFYPASQIPRSQIQQGILAKNPDAFKSGNMNFLIQGKPLILPDDIKLSSFSSQNDKPQQGNGNENGLNDINNASIEQSEKVSQLEKESEELKVRLEKLVAEKTASDEKLREIEMALQKSTNQSGGK